MRLLVVALFLALCTPLIAQPAAGLSDLGVPVTTAPQAPTLPQVSPAPSAESTGAPEVLPALMGFLRSLQGGDLLTMLIALVNLLMVLLKMDWVQGLVKRFVVRAENWEMTSRQKVVLIFLLGVGVSHFAHISPDPVRSAEWGCLVGLAAIGTHQVWRIFIFPKKVE